MKKNDIPDWLDKVIWAEFKKHRNRLRKPMTQYAEHLLLNKLDKLRIDGYDPNTLLNESIEMGWQTVFFINVVGKEYACQLSVVG